MEKDPEKMVWSPGLETAPLSAAALELKLGSLVTMLLMTVISGTAPLVLFRRQGSPDNIGTRRWAQNLASCFSAGVFMATCLLDLMPNYLAGINNALERLNLTLQFPLQEFILAMGLFMVLIMEQIVLSYMDHPGSSEEKHVLLGSDGHFHHNSLELSHVHVDVNAHSAVRAVVLLVSLSLHSVVEGIGLGQQQNSGKVLKTCLALLLHKSIISFGVILKLGQGRLRVQALFCCVLLFSVMSPLGIGLGVTLTQGGDPVHQLTLMVLEGIAAGAFLYITFLEVLPHELSSREHPIHKVIVLLCGFSVIAGILFINI
ncbi:zinc transporter ZIP1 [Rhinophrynus dorsalis]